MFAFIRRLLSLSGICLLAAGVRGADLDVALESGDLKAAEEELEALSAEWRAAWEAAPEPATAREFGAALHALGIVERQAGKPAEARGHLEEALRHLDTAGPAARADAREALALTLQDLGQTGEAGKLLRAALSLRSSLPEAEREPSLSIGRDHLALNLLAQGKYAEADGLLRRNLEATPPGDPEARARRLGYYGRYLHTMGSHARAAAIFREALALPLADRELVLSLGSQLALAELRLGKTENARAGMEQAAEEAVSLYSGKDKAFRAAPYLNNLGALDLALGNPLQARAAFAEALALLESSLGPQHPALASPLNNLGCAEQAAGNYPAAEAALGRAAALQARHLPRLHLRVAETSRNLARNALLSGSPDAARKIEDATRLGLDLLENLIRHGSERERLNFLQRLDLVSLACATGDGGRILDILAASKARLLDSMLEPRGQPPGSPPGWQQLQAALEPGTALVDTCRYLTVSPEPEERYGAVLLLPQGPPKWVPLGSAEDLQHGLAAFQKRLSWKASALAGKDAPPPTLKMRGILRSLHAGFWAPLERELPAETRHLAFSPDSALHFLPLPVLLDEEMAPLCSRYLQICTVTSARDLLEAPAAASLSSGPWTVFGVSSFPRSRRDPGGDRLQALLSELDDMPGTAEELKLLGDLAPEGSTFLRDAAATEKALLALPAPPRVLHLGCHAFFMHDAPESGEPVDFDENADLLFSGGLLLHGAALRGADAPPVSPEDDLLYPSEIAGLELQGTRLVTLSSCESGAGTAVSGEGLLGLRRGFALAGAREVLVALWPVSDRSTPEFMERFYRLALASDRSNQALWQCQSEFISAAGNSEEEFEAAVLRYGPFVLSQKGPLAAGAEITPAPRNGFRRIYLWTGLPLVLFLLARFARKRKDRSTAAAA